MKMKISLYDRSVLGRPTLRNDEPAFDAANCLKLGYDVLYLISNTGNQAGADWLQDHLGPSYRVHPVRDVYAFIHIDSTITLLRPGLVLLCPTRVKEDQIPECIRNWDRIWCPDPVEVPSLEEWGGASKWIAMNILSIGPDLAAVEANQVPLMRELEKHGVNCLPVQLRHTRTLGGGPHCVSLDLFREGEVADYR